MDAPSCLRVVCLQMLCCHWRFLQLSLLDPKLPSAAPDFSNALSPSAGASRSTGFIEYRPEPRFRRSSPLDRTVCTGAYELVISGKFHLNPLTAITASVRLVTFNAMRMAVTWSFTVGRAKLRDRQISLLLFPRIM
jgi:hypothetical protein